MESVRDASETDERTRPPRFGENSTVADERCTGQSGWSAETPIPQEAACPSINCEGEGSKALHRRLVVPICSPRHPTNLLHRRYGSGFERPNVWQPDSYAERLLHPRSRDQRSCGPMPSCNDPFRVLGQANRMAGVKTGLATCGRSGLHHCQFGHDGIRRLYCWYFSAGSSGTSASEGRTSDHDCRCARCLDRDLHHPPAQVSASTCFAIDVVIAFHRGMG